MKKLAAFPYEDADVHALKAVAAGVASAGQQQRAIRYILNVSGIRDMPSWSEHEQETLFDNGRKFVGWHIAKLIELVGVTTDLPTKKG